MANEYFSNRNETLTKVNAAMNYLSRIIRENVVLFDFDAKSDQVTYLTESNKLVSCKLVDSGNGIVLEGVKMDDASEMFSNEKVDSQVDDSISKFVNSLRGDTYNVAETNFNSILEAFEGRSKIGELRSKLDSRSSNLSEIENIIDSEEFQNLLEIKDYLVEFVRENKEDLLGVEEISNSLKLCALLTKTFAAEKKTLDDIVAEGKLSVPYDENKTVFDMVCAQELIRSELNESKENFTRSWVKNEKIGKLASCIYNTDDVIEEALVEAISDVPYLALASKADIKDVFASIYESTRFTDISQKDVRDFVAKIFEMKKDAKSDIIDTLSENYGINIQNLKFVPTFSHLAKTQSVLFETLESVIDDRAVLYGVVAEFAKALRRKNGIQVLEINDFINEVFTEAGVEVTPSQIKPAKLSEVAGEVVKKKGAKPGFAKKTVKIKGKVQPKSEKGEEKEEEEEGEEEPEAEEKENGKKGKKGKSKEEEFHSKERYSEAVEPNEEAGIKPGLSDDDMKTLMSELEQLFSDIDWNALAKEESDVDARGSEDAQPEEEEQV